MEINYKLPEKFILELTKLPETGMGYQLVNIKFMDGKTLENIIVFNSEIIKVDDEIKVDPNKISKIELVK